MNEKGHSSLEEPKVSGREAEVAGLSGGEQEEAWLEVVKCVSPLLATPVSPLPGQETPA